MAYYGYNDEGKWVLHTGPLFKCTCGKTQDPEHKFIGASPVHDFRDFTNTPSYQEGKHDIQEIGVSIGKPVLHLAFYRMSGCRAITPRLYNEMVRWHQQENQ